MRLAAFSSRGVRKSMLRRFLLGSQASDEALSWLLDWSDSVNWRATAKIVRGLHGFDLSDRLSEILCPTLIVCGEEDKLAPLRMSEFMHERIEDSELKVVNGAGHCSSAEKPQQFNRIVTEFLDKVPR
jgi:pimeloyl-ACP methyl ester carboxylesterase